MTKNIFTGKSIFLHTLILSLSLIFISAGTVLASSENAKVLTTQSQNAHSESALLEKQQEIDKYVFEDHAKEIAGKGFKVTNTGQIKDYVELGITPYSEANADYLYKIFGKENVKVVEGIQSQLTNNALSTAAEPLIAEPAANGVSPVIYAVNVLAAIVAASLIMRRRKVTK
jgi:hypothetical protein